MCRQTRFLRRESDLFSIDSHRCVVQSGVLFFLAQNRLFFNDERRFGMTRGTVLIDRNRCKGCGLCVESCPQGVLQLSATYNARGYRPVFLDESQHPCTGCAICAVICPDVVFTVYRESRRQPAQPQASPA
jgi:2-oxoglutarate ferredoxin oxidoreductase subunit delta